MCKVLQIGRSSYYKWLKGGISKSKLENRMLLSNIHDIFEKSRHTYGRLRISKELGRMGIKASKVRVAKLMRGQGWEAKLRGSTALQRTPTISPRLPKITWEGISNHWKQTRLGYRKLRIWRQVRDGCTLPLSWIYLTGRLLGGRWAVPCTQGTLSSLRGIWP